MAGRIRGPAHLGISKPSSLSRSAASDSGDKPRACLRAWSRLGGTGFTPTLGLDRRPQGLGTLCYLINPGPGSTWDTRCSRAHLATVFIDVSKTPESEGGGDPGHTSRDSTAYNSVDAHLCPPRQLCKPRRLICCQPQQLRRCPCQLQKLSRWPCQTQK